MSGVAYPPDLLTQIASGAGSTYITNPMPTAPTGTQAASIDEGFPAITMTPENAGGEPPDGQDFNGFLFLLSSHILFKEAGQGYTYKTSISTAIGGYPLGALLAMSDGTGFWLSLVDANTANPDTGGAGWVPLGAYGVGLVTTTGGTTVVGSAIWKYGIIQIEGALTSNAVVEVPHVTQSWIVINQTTGAFNVTVKTPDSGSTGVLIPQNGPQGPVPVYSIGDGNIYPVVAPLGAAISIPANPATIVERDGNANVFATYFNGNAAVESVPAIGAVFVQNTAADGYARKASIAQFISVLALVTNSSLATALSAYAPNNSPTLTGVPKAPTAATGTNTTQIATMAAIIQALAANISVLGSGASGGSIKIGSIIINYGLATVITGGVPVVQSLTTIYSVSSYTVQATAVGATLGTVLTSGPGTSSAQKSQISLTGGATGMNISWFTIGQ